MIRNYFKIAWRNLVKNKALSFINIGGLSVGMAVAMLISLWIWDELSFNTYHHNYNHIAQVMLNQTRNGGINTGPGIPAGLALSCAKVMGTILKTPAMSSFSNGHILAAGEKTLILGKLYGT